MGWEAGTSRCKTITRKMDKQQGPAVEYSDS